jgi:hypothetical protein
MAESDHPAQDEAARRTTAARHAVAPAGEALDGRAPDAAASYPVALSGNTALAGRGNGPVRTTLMLDLQRRAGNRATQRSLQRMPLAGPESALDGAAPTDPALDPAAPGAIERFPVGPDGAGAAEETVREPGEDPAVLRAPPGGGSGSAAPPAAGARPGTPPAAGAPPAPPATVAPTGIASTAINSATPGLGATYYGWIFTHTLSTTGGTITPDITIAEKVTAGRDDFATGFGGVALGTLTWGPGAGGTAPITGNTISDNIGTNNINVRNFLPHPPKPGLPAVQSTPQELHYRVGAGAWTKFADVPITVTLQNRGAGGGYEVVTSDNSLGRAQRYTGPV